MNILHICSYYTTSRLYSNLINDLDEKGIKNIVYIPIKEKSEIGKFKSENTNLSKFIYSRCFSSLDRINFYKKQRKIYSKIDTLIEEEKDIELVHAHSLFTNGHIAYKLKKEKNIDYIVAVRSTDIEIFFKYVIHLRKLGIKILKEAKQVIFISHSYKNKCIKKYIPKEIRSDIDSKSIVIPNGIDQFWFDNIVKPIEYTEGREINLIYVGQLIKRKNIEKSILAVKELNKKGYKSKLKVIGSGKLKNKLIRYSEKNGKFTEFIDFLDKINLIEMYRKSDIFIMPSKQETFGLVYIEAMTQGIPIIYSKNEGIDGYFDNGSVGYAVDNKNINDICEKIIKINKNYSEINRMCINSSKEFKWSLLSNNYIEIYKKSIESRQQNNVREF